MAGDGLLRAVAAAAASLGVLTAATGNGVVALFAGAGAVASAALAARKGSDRSSNGAAESSSAAIDLRAAPAAAIDDPVNRGASPQLLDAAYLAAALRGRVAVARRALRPLSVVHVMIVSHDAGGPVAAELIAAAAEATLRESDIVGRRDDGVYVVLLEDTGEDGAVWTTERLRRHIVGTIGPKRFQAGVASYPNHGLDAESVDASAARALVAAQEWDRDRIEVAVH